MRGAAALIVALGHARSLFFASVTGTTAAGQLTIGDEAVMIFFVLSGYLVGGSVSRDMAADRWSWFDYLTKRMVRLWIVLIPAVFIGIGFDAIGVNFLAQHGSIYAAPPHQSYVQDSLSDQIKSVLIILGNLVFLQTIIVPTIGTNSALWSLSNEFWYYLLFPMGMLAVRYEKRPGHRVAYALAVVLILWLIGGHASLLFLSWLLGAGVAVVPRMIPAARARGTLVMTAIVFGAVFLGIKKCHLPLFIGEMVVALSVSALVYAIVCHTAPNQPSLYGWIARWSSNLSYSLYLTHLPFLIFLCALINTPWQIAAFTAATFTKFLVSMVGALALAAFVYYCFESRTDVTRTFLGTSIRKYSAGAKKWFAAQ